MRSFVVRLIGVVVTAQLLACNQSDADQAKVHATRGDLAVEQQKFHEATIEYLNAVQHAQNDAAIRWKLVQASLQAADFNLAFKELHNLMRLDPRHADARLMLGRLYLTGGKREEAAKVAADLISTLPNHPAGYLLQGELDTQAGSFKEAVAQFERAHELDADLLQSILASANVSMLQQDHVRAFQWYQQVSDRYPNSADVHVARGNYFFTVGDQENGEREFSGP